MTVNRGGDDDLLPEQTADDRDAGWGERQVDDDEAESRLLEERPPHHDR